MKAAALLLLVGVAFAASCGDSTSPGGPAPASLQIVSGDGQTTASGTPYAAPLVVRVLGTDTLPLRGTRVDFRVAAGPARIDSQTAVTDESGLARAFVTPTAPGSVQLAASVFSSNLSAIFLLAAGGTGSVACDAGNTRTLVPVQIANDIGANGVCVAPDSVVATYVLVVFNSPALDAPSTAATVTVSGSGVGAAPSALPDVASRDGTVQLEGAGIERAGAVTGFSAAPSLSALVPRAQSWWRHRSMTARSAAAVESVGQLRQINVNFADPCANATYRTGRVAAVSATAVIIVDTADAAALPAAPLDSAATIFDDMVSPADTLNFRAPADIDTNGRVVLFVSRRVNPVNSAVGPVLAWFQRRDVLPASTCPASNGGELLYLAVPDSTGAFGPARTTAQWLAGIPRALAHEYQHLINASRRLYVVQSPDFEVSWLDEGLSQISEELLYHRWASRVSRQNLGAYDVALTQVGLAAFDAVQRDNVELYRRFLAAGAAGSPLASADSPETRGGTWSLLRYLADRREWVDYVSWTGIVNTSAVGMQNLSNVFGANVRAQMRDWATSLLTDDLFAGSSFFQQPSWNFRSLFAALRVQPYPLVTSPLTAASPVTVTLPPAGAAYLAFTVPPSGVAGISWSGPGAAVSPMLQWALVRLQ